MKVIIDIPEDHKRVIDNLVEDGKGYLLPYEVETRLAKAVKIGTVIPDNTTVGNVIKAMFSNLEVREKAFEIELNVNKNKVGNISIDWWNAPYKKESEK